MFQFEGYNPSDEIDEDEQFLSKIPLDLMKEAIRDQFIDPIDNHKRDYVQSFLDKYEFSREHQREEEDDYELDEFYSQFISHMINLMSENLSVGFPDIEDKSEKDQLEIIQLTYRFFIRRIKKNFMGVVLNYINDNGEFILESLPRKRDVTTNNFENIVNELDLRVLSNMDSVIDLALERDYTVEEFINACSFYDDSLETDFMKRSFDDDTITGNFVEMYISFVDNDLKGEIASKVRNTILQKYPLKKKDLED